MYNPKIKVLNFELFIAKRLVRKEYNKGISQSVVKIAKVSIALGLTVMILAVGIVTGFQSQIKEKVIGFGSHIIITKHDTNTSLESKPISKKQSFYPNLSRRDGIKHIQVFAQKAGIIKTDKEIQGIVVKGIGSDFDWSFFEKNIVAGSKFVVSDSTKSNSIVISKLVADMLELSVGDKLIVYFVQDPPRMRKFTISGIYETSLEEFDKLIVLADIAHIQRLNNWSKDQISGFEVLVDNFEELEEKYEELYDEFGFRFLPDGSKLQISTIEQKNSHIFEWLELSNTNVWIILTLMVLVAGFNMISSLLIIILERTTTIGVLKSLGATNASIRTIFMNNAAYLIIRGLIWGNLLGIGLCLLQQHFGIIGLDPSSYYVAEVPINLRITDVLLLNFGVILVTLLMLLIPSAFVSKISPIRAIRFE